MQKHHFRVVISYNGGNYYGWQDLGDAEDKPTIQRTITQALRQICNYAECTVSGASRTDAGVHAQGQVAKLTIPIEITSEKIQLGLNSLLPEDIRIRQSIACSSDFNPNKEAIGKKYRYYFSIDQISSPSFLGVVAHIPSKIEAAENTLDLDIMRRACELMVGEYDFYSFASRDKNIDSTIRNIASLQLKRTEALDLESEIYYFEIEGDRFLKHMVRYIVSAIFAVGRQEISIEDIAAALSQRMEQKLSPKAKARGLHLLEISY